MEIRFNLEKEARKTLVRVLSEITGEKAVYLGAPSFAYTIGEYAIDRYGTLSCGGLPDALPALLDELSARGYVYDSDTGGESSPEEREILGGGGSRKDEDAMIAEDGETAENGSETAEDAVVRGNDRLSIEMLLSGFAPTDIANVENLVTAKAWVFRKMTGAEELPIERLKDRLSFPWFRPDSTAAEIDAYSRLIARLCETAKTKKRVAAIERPPEPGDNEKFKARCALLALGFIGAEYAQARKILLAPFSGSGSHKTGDGRKAAAGA
jgi:hypothetical protein